MRSPIAAPAAQLTLKDLQVADVLLSRGKGLVSDWIATADGGAYSHSALWSGKAIIQATSEGITDTHVSGTHGVYRYATGLDAAGAAEVVAAAQAEVNGKYAYGELAILGLLFSSGLRVKGALLTRMLEAIGGSTALRLKEWLDQCASNGTRVCSELVASCYFKSKGRRLALKILPVAQRPAAAPVPTLALELPPLSDDAPDGTIETRAGGLLDEPSPKELANAAGTCRALLEACGLLKAEPVRGTTAELPALTGEAASSTRKLFADAIALDAITGGLIGVVTPADLQFSPSLRYLGQLVL